MTTEETASGSSDSLKRELCELTSMLCEQRLTTAQAGRLSALLRENPRLVADYVDMMQLHAQLQWDAGHGIWLSDTGMNSVVAEEYSSPDEATAVSSEPLTDHIGIPKPDLFAETSVRPEPPVPLEPPDSLDTPVFKGSSRVPVIPDVDRSLDASIPRNRIHPASIQSARRRRTRHRQLTRVTVAVGMSLLTLLAIFMIRNQSERTGGTQSVVGRMSQRTVQDITSSDHTKRPVPSAAQQDSRIRVPDAQLKTSQGPTLQLDASHIQTDPVQSHPASPELAAADVSKKKSAGAAGGTPLTVDQSSIGGPGRDTVASTVAVDDDEVIGQINSLLQLSWQENDVQPSVTAGDHEWMRRIHLVLTGTIPAYHESAQYLSAAPARRRSNLIRQLLNDERNARYLANVWTNLLIGRSNPGKVDRRSLQGWLQARFAANEPWIDVVGELISAEGRSDQNGATNFLLAHLNDKATPATAVTSRLFFGEQVHCTQCHDHPFAKGIRQSEFWELNAFFQQTTRQAVNGNVRQMSEGGIWRLEDSDVAGMMFYETLRGQQVAVLPEFGGETLNASDLLPLRHELARLIHEDAELRVARSMVNRMWLHFFGAGFTHPVDDMGPHNPVSHPQLLQVLSRSFADSGYDIQRLMLWIASCDAWQLSSIPAAGSGRVATKSGTSRSRNNISDEPGLDGQLPLFTRVYTRYLEPEQVYDSIRTSVRSIAGHVTPGRIPPDTASDEPIDDEHRRAWVQQFVEALQTDENDERLTFEGDITQALLMMNGRDVEMAIPAAVASLTGKLTRRPPDLNEALYHISMSVLIRPPTEREVTLLKNRYRNLSATQSAEQAFRISLEDLLWAYLNSSEFVSAH